jgi:hypothetical protein
MFKFQAAMSLDAGEALLKVWKEVRKKYSERSVPLYRDKRDSERTGAAVSVIADDSDARRRRGLMVYPSVEFCTFGDRQWILGLGHKGGSYPGSEYRNNIMAVQQDWSHFGKTKEIPGYSIRGLAQWIGSRNDWFQASVLTSTKDGRLFFHGPIERFRDESLLSQFVINTNEVNGVSIRGQTVPLGFAYTFSRDFPHFLAEEIARALSQ